MSKANAGQRVRGGSHVFLQGWWAQWYSLDGGAWDDRGAWVDRWPQVDRGPRDNSPGRCRICQYCFFQVKKRRRLPTTHFPLPLLTLLLSSECRKHKSQCQKRLEISPLPGDVRRLSHAILLTFGVAVHCTRSQMAFEIPQHVKMSAATFARFESTSQIGPITVVTPP